MRGVARMPWGIQRGLGGAAGGLMYRLMRRRRRIAETNLALCFPHLDDAARARLVRRHFRSLGLALVGDGACLVGQRSRGSWRARASWAPSTWRRRWPAGRGVILLGGHFTTFELSGRILASRFECGATYRPHDDPRWDAILRAGRGRHLAALVPHKDARAMIRHLAGNRILWYAPDQDFSSRRGRRSVFVRFFRRAGGGHDRYRCGSRARAAPGSSRSRRIGLRTIRAGRW